MSFDINSFRANLTGDGARPNLFDVFLTIPSNVDIGNGSPKVRFLARATVLPGSDIGVTPLMYFGREIKLAGNRTFADWNIDIINDEDYAVRRGLEAWSNGINNHVTGQRDPAFLTSLGYTSQATVQHYGKDGTLLRVYSFVGLFPTSIAPINLDWGSNDTIMEFNCTFQYQYWEAGSNAAGNSDF